MELLAYTSIANADTTGMKLAAEHQATETLLRESGVPFVLLRNGWYLENYTEQLPGTLAQGAFAGSAGDGKVSGAARADYAHAAAAVLVADDQAGKVYELGGDHAFSMAELAAEITAATGHGHHLPRPSRRRLRRPAGRFGVPAAFAGHPGGLGPGHRPGRPPGQLRRSADADRPPDDVTRRGGPVRRGFGLAGANGARSLMKGPGTVASPVSCVAVLPVWAGRSGGYASCRGAGVS